MSPPCAGFYVSAALKDAPAKGKASADAAVMMLPRAPGSQMQVRTAICAG